MTSFQNAVASAERPSGAGSGIGMERVKFVEVSGARLVRPLVFAGEGDAGLLAGTSSKSGIGNASKAATALDAAGAAAAGFGFAGAAAVASKRSSVLVTKKR